MIFLLILDFIFDFLTIYLLGSMVVSISKQKKEAAKFQSEVLKNVNFNQFNSNNSNLF
ncbi:MAG: hypothetical protein MJ232_03075 [archaeon]|nr:hypothetical protein [archaeon]